MQKILLLLIISSIQFCTTVGSLSKGPASDQKIAKFTQFSTWRALPENPTDEDLKSLLGWVLEETQDGATLLPQYKYWNGTPMAGQTSSKLTVTYDSTNKAYALAKFKDKAKAEASFAKVKSIIFEMENAVEEVLTSPKPNPKYKKRPDIRQKPFIISLLKVGKVTIKVQTEDGLVIAAKGDLEKQGIDLELGIDGKSSDKSGLTAENIYVGYKLGNPPTYEDVYE